ncbi:extracellular solute-binding protein [Paenibacillus sp. PL2-23]|uniref:extracellular solute-binding protein n=1 Tax=Paenibacillus sp. PL2-23 TaxID=2100729 RepID=UPI0030F6A5E7
MRQKRTMLAVTLTLLLALLLSACSGNGSNGNSNGTSAASSNPSKEPVMQEVEITFANWISVEDATKDIYNDLMDEFEKQNPGITVKSIGYPFNQYKDQVLVSSAGGNAPDVIMANQNFTSAFVGADIAAPMDELLEASLIDDILEGSLKGVTYGNKVMAMPWAPHPNALFWNKKLFEKAGLDPNTPPQTWDEMLMMADKIAKLGQDEKGNPIYGIGENTKDTSYTGNMLYRIVLSYGGKFVDDEGKVVFDEGTALRDALAYIQTLVTNKTSPKGAEIFDLRGMFGNGTLGMVSDGDFGRSVFRGTSGKGEAFDEEWGVTTIPVNQSNQSETVFTEHQLVISKDGKQKDAAAKLVTFLVSEDAMKMYHAANGVLSSRKSIAALPEMNEDEYAKVFNAQMATATALPTQNPKFDNAMKEAASMVVMVSEGSTPEEAIARIMPKIKELYQ